jgi:hypothetical protein
LVVHLWCVQLVKNLLGRILVMLHGKELQLQLLDVIPEVASQNTGTISQKRPHQLGRSVHTVTSVQQATRCPAPATWKPYDVQSQHEDGPR